MSDSKSATKLTDRKRAAILSAAVNLFSQTCFDQVSMDDIAEVAQVSKRTVYNHFDSKDALFAAIVDGLKEGCRKAAEIADGDSESLGQRLTRFGMQVVNFHCRAESRRLARIILPRLLLTPTLGRALFGGSKLFEQELVRILQIAMDQKELQPLEPPWAAKQFLGQIESFVVWPQLIGNQPNPSPATRKRVVNDAVSMFLAQYSPAK